MYIEKPKTFKAIIKEMTSIITEDDRNRVFWQNKPKGKLNR